MQGWDGGLSAPARFPPPGVCFGPSRSSSWRTRLLNKFQTHTLPLHAARIEDYAMIGDCETAALVSKQGSIDWLCWPSFSDPACFASLLGTADHGLWKIAPLRRTISVTRRYLPGTLIVETTFTTSTGSVALVDFMPPRGDHSDIVRLMRGVHGKVRMHMQIGIRFDYGRTVPWVTHTGFGLRAIAGQDMVTLRTRVPLAGVGLFTESDFTVAAGETVPFTLTYSSALGADGNAPTVDPSPFPPEQALADTETFWREWTARGTDQGPYAELVQRSLITLKAMTYKPSGGIVAAVTASLPEKIGGVRNWDYRYCWLRDTAFTLLVLLHAGYDEEATAWRRWLLRAIAGAPSQIQTIYGICGDRQLTEFDATWLPGYEHSQPVHIGNRASEQFQLDVFGEVATALLRTPEADDDIKLSASAVQAQLMDHLCKVWTEPDDGIWETRGKRKHFTYSKVMAWVALDRAIQHYEQFDGGGNIERWKKNRDLIHKQVCEKGFSRKLNSFTQSYGSDQLDASCLRIGLVGFLPMDDPRIVGTVDAIGKHLNRDGFIERYNTKTSPDGLPPGEGAFLACSFWMVTSLWLIGRQAEARAMFERLIALRNDVGLFSEEWQPAKPAGFLKRPEPGRMLGNFPQALTHIAMAHAAFTLSGNWRPQPSTQPKV